MIDLEAYLRQALEGFCADPPDSDFQRGYLAALLEVAKTCELGVAEEFKDLGP